VFAGNRKFRVDADGHTAETVWADGFCLPGIENFALIGGIPAAIKNRRAVIHNRGVQIQLTGKVSRPLCLRRNQKKLRRCQSNAQALIIPEEKCPVFNDRTAQGSSELILLVLLPSKKIKSVASVQVVIAEKFVGIAVKSIGAGLDHRIHNGAVPPAKFGAVGVGFYLKFPNGIHRGLDHVRTSVQHVSQIGVVIDAVQ